MKLCQAILLYSSKTFANVIYGFYLCGTVHKIAAAILLLAFFGQTFNQGVYYLDYLIDKAEYVKNCVNKARPKMKCNGKCQVMKKIEEQEKKQQEQAPEMKLAGKSEVFSAKNWYTIFTPLYLTEAKHYYPIYHSDSPIDQPSSFFHPPQT